MRLIRSSILVSALLLASVNCWGFDLSSTETKEESNRSPSVSVQAEKSNADKLADEMPVTSIEKRGAVPQLTQAEKIRKAEEDLQDQILATSKEVDTLEKRAKVLRGQSEAPLRWDLDRIEHDIALLSDEINRLDIPSSSPLAQVQRNDLQERVFEVQLSLEIAKRRWGGSWAVFGTAFFSNVPPTPTTEQRPAPENYRLRVGDKLKIDVISNLGQENEYHPAVDTGGTVYVPGAGSVKASGKTCGDLQILLTRKINSRFRQLRVTVSVESLATLQIQVSGEVVRPGAYTLTGLVTVLNALYQAGGPSKSGTFRKIRLVREGEPDRTIDLYDFLINGSKRHDVPLKDGDMIFVPPVGQTIVVEGDVIRPARYEPTFPITLKEALMMAGGPRASGYLQTVQVERIENNENRILLDEPVKGKDGQSSFMLKPGDQITVIPVRPDKTNQVSITGPVRVSGIYGFSNGMRINDLIKLAQGLDPSREVFGGRADVLRSDSLKGVELITLNLDKALKGDAAENIELRKLDRIFIYQPDQVVFRPKLITVNGAVAKPGIYRRTDGMRVSDVVAAAGGVLPSAYLDRADLIRYAPDGSTELIRVKLEAALSGDTEQNYKLGDRDEIAIYKRDEVIWSDRRVRVDGAVQKPGVYVRSKNMHLSDLLFASGGLLPEAGSVAEIGRSTEAGQSATIKVDIKSIASAGDNDPELHDRDVVTIPAVNLALRSPQVVYITGEVVNPGPYVLKGPDDKLTDIIERAGGLTTYADCRGTLFLRQKERLENSQQEKDVDFILQKSRIFADKQFMTHMAKLGGTIGGSAQTVQHSMDAPAKPADVVEESRLTKDIKSEDALSVQAKSIDDTSASATATYRSQAGLEQVEKTTAMGSALTSASGTALAGYEGRQELALLMNSTRVSISLDRALKQKESPDNLSMRHGDHIFIPKITNVVTVIGAVLQPHTVAAGPGKNVGYYIKLSGGLAPDAARENIVVVRSNGDALPAKEVKSVEPGDMVVVPTTGLIDITKSYEKIGSMTKMLADILSTAFIITRF